jgi:hypothetical protein
MGFGISASVPKIPAAPKVPDAPKAPDLKAAAAGAAAGFAAGAQAAVAGAAKSAMAGVAATAKAAVSGAGAAAKSLSAVAGALAEVAVSFQGPSVDMAMEPHMVLDANASYGETRFEKGPVWIRVDLPAVKARENGDTLRLYSADGAYDRKKPIREFDEEQGRMVDVLFADAPMNQAYSLEVIPASGSPRPMFREIPYGDLRKTMGRL